MAGETQEPQTRAETQPHIGHIPSKSESAFTMSKITCCYMAVCVTAFQFLLFGHLISDFFSPITSS